MTDDAAAPRLSAGPSGRTDAVSVDVERAAEVVEFYRGVGRTVGDAVRDLRDHGFGAWTDADDEHHEHAVRHTAMVGRVAERLATRAAAAAELADGLERGVHEFRTADAEVAASFPPPARGGDR
ncbi:hypothetical protein [Gordonia soli]|uniref:ESX-1 secretion-associated protein n=1 Tax=Gordonia soli NBRC 108243 TaxID=1223545 RepID=M0QQI8_9ACTN|nr:hypothetical protein [Gordonia soli]GAC70511.1 hypothetical protein GS4_35_00870 [Gordonia soli NBRC 108243]